MERIYTDSDANPAALQGPVAIVGYGSQGRAHARNLRDSGFDVIVGARAGGGAERRAKADGFRVAPIADAAREAKLVALLTPDMTHREVYARDVEPNLSAGDALLVAHGFSVLYEQVKPREDIDVVLVAPKGPGDLVRREYEIGRGVPSLFAVYQDATGSALGPFGFAVDRVLEVGLGCAAGLVVSVLIVPARASRLVLETAAQVMRLLAEQLEAMSALSDQAQADLSALAVRTRETLTKLETLVGEAARERRSRLADAPDPEPLFRTLMRLRHDVVMLRRALREPRHEALREHVAQPWSRAARTGAAALRDLGQALSEGQAPERSAAVAEAVGDYRSALDDMRRRELTKPLPTDAVWLLFGAGFALEQFRRDLDDLVERLQELLSGGEGAATG